MAMLSDNVCDGWCTDFKREYDEAMLWTGIQENPEPIGRMEGDFAPRPVPVLHGDATVTNNVAVEDIPFEVGCSHEGSS